MRWTADQAKVITSRGKNLLVAAAAGSGKTTVLVERVMRLVEEGANIDEMLIVTFTRAASSDMREKFRKRFREIAEMGVPHAQEQLERLENASISTLHSFCTDVLKNHFEAAGVDPMFRIIDDAEDKQLTERAMDEALENAYLAGGEIMDKLDFARGPMRVRSLVMDMHAFLKERPDPDAWFENALSLMDGDGESWIRVLEGAVREKLSNALALNEYAISLAMEPEGPNHYAPALETDAEAIHEIMHAPYRKMHAMISTFKQVTPRGGKRIKAEDKTERQIYLSETASAVRKKVKTQVESAQRIVSLDADLSMEDIRQNKAIVRKLFEITKDLENRLRVYKEKRCALTFNDLEHYTLKALCDERVSESIKNRFSHVFVDEYQDTSDVQEAIVSKISRGNNRFMVGDVKQSIYRFRQAEPKLFL
ncbi:MAG: UvrD-helicase domain-containing protein, partial [Clostridia bacterium]|nr:UvrD-helicase domain-containing protein [Clostridia bacterium]